MSGTVRAASMRPRSSAFSSTLTSMMTSRRPSGRFWMSRVTAMRISPISVSVTAADGTARRSLPSTSPMSFACSTMFPRASPAFLTSRLLPVSCSCQTMTWAMAVTCSAPAEPQRTQREKPPSGGFSCALSEPAPGLQGDPGLNRHIVSSKFERNLLI